MMAGTLIRHFIFIHFLYLLPFFLILHSVCYAHNCTEEEGFYLPDKNGSCPANMIRTSDEPCCTCVKRHYKPSCQVDADVCAGCFPCIKCENQHREFQKQCSLTQDAICGKCETGYYQPKTKGSKNGKCIKCKTGSLTPECFDYLDDNHKTTTFPSKITCIRDIGLFDPHWDGQCPSGTTWNSILHCCEKCKDCKNRPFQWGSDYIKKDILCDRNHNKFYKHWDGQCPTGTFWQPESRCCKGYRLHSHTLLSYERKNEEAKLDSPQGDKEELVCKSELNNFLPFEENECPLGTVISKNGCCHGCPDCAPGWKRGPHCVGGCFPCPRQFYSDDSKNNLECFPCTDCADLNRVKSFKCVPVKDTQCGQCFDGYTENTNKENSTCLKVENVLETTQMPSVVEPKVHSLGCDQSLAQFKPYWDGSCPQETKFCNQTQCCVPFRKCGPGYMHMFQENCASSCEPCPQGKFSDDLEDNNQCSECLECKKIHRYTSSQCSPTANTVCGGCLPGFYEPSTEGIDIPFIPCKECEQGNCHLSYKEAKPDKVYIVENNNNLLFFILIGLAGTIVVLLIIGIIVFVCYKRVHRTYSCTDGPPSVPVTDTGRYQTIETHPLLDSMPSTQSGVSTATNLRVELKGVNLPGCGQKQEGTSINIID